jgi:5-methylthioadenosine/S-adenosylhomocysteine deaminase
METVDLIISGGACLTAEPGLETIEDVYIAVKGDKILDIGDKSEIQSRYAAEKEIDASGCLVIPGLINAHTHSPMTCFRGIADDLPLDIWLDKYIFPIESKFMNAEAAYWGTLLAAVEMIKSGTTTFCDMYFYQDSMAKAAKEAGMRAVLSHGILDFPFMDCEDPEHHIKITRQYMETWAGDPLITVCPGPHAIYTCNRTKLRDAKDLADEAKVPYVIHLSETKKEVEDSKANFDKLPVFYLEELGVLGDNVLAAHGVWLSKKEMRVLKAYGVTVAHNPESNMKLAAGIAPVTDMLKIGINVCLGTDGCASNNNLDMLQEMDTAAKLQKVDKLDPTALSAKETFLMATINGARGVLMEDKIGSLKKGKRADISIIDMNKPHNTPVFNYFSHLVYSVNSADVDTVIINGKIVMENRRITTVDEEEIKQKVREIASHIKENLDIGAGG